MLCLIVAAGAGYWVYTMPYPLRTYLKARSDTRYSPGWAMSEADYRQARSAVEKRLGRREILGVVTVVSPTKVRFDTLIYWSGPLAAAGRILEAEKVNGAWTVTEAGRWMS